MTSAWVIQPPLFANSASRQLQSAPTEGRDVSESLNAEQHRIRTAEAAREREVLGGSMQRMDIETESKQ